METQQHRVYKALGPRHIRLFRISGALEAADIGHFEEFSLDDVPAFYTLSHCWGCERQEYTFTIEGHTLKISKHLADGLQCLQQLAGVHSSLSPPLQYVWIDCICIDQTNLNERATQVRLMGTIYSRAIRTLIWLGPKSHDSASSWSLISDIYNLLQKNHPNIDLPEQIPHKMFSEAQHIGTGLPAFADPKWSVLREIFDVQWFSRLWVVQEVVLSSLDPVFIHGNHTHSWHKVEWAAAWLRRNGYLRLPHITESLLYVDSIGYLRRTKVKWPLSALMSITQKKFHATDQRDKIYSLLGLAAETDNATTTPDALLPDYTIDVQQTYMKATRYFLEHDRSLAILTRTRGTPKSISRARRQHDLGDWLSWLPDWSDFAVPDRELRKSFSWIHYSDPDRPARLGFPIQYRSAGNLPLRIHRASDPAILRVEGLKVDTVAEVLQLSSTTTFAEEFGENFDSCMTRILSVALPLIQHTTFESWAARLIKTTTADQHDLSGRTSEQSLKDGYAYLHKQLSNTQPIIHNELMGWLREVAVGGISTEFAALACNFCYARSFLVTNSERIGIGPSDSSVGDRIAVIPGGGVPYLLRPDGEAWTFVGEAYVHDIMNGEMVEGDVVMEYFDLR
ncbi:hypothetical protein HBH98_126210 [Parastagonospora nodorum]|nr:hypothetical protein HBH52_158920 [Parastagonospora nodorum]KAH4028417.1 hypothetical protein HBI09_136720 [Parastagonospora nodorum]KAH4257521.1 hypothetical protein HBI03_153050 [Parastagonospora nodorum]KAH4272973.1 hypothetical protein HBI04_141480 [Parastagonospora nodorum]KAH4345272.1 hypothetical protein HBH98_126210 [Parastagonospora nodorum]